MQMKWAFLLVACAGVATALFDPSDRAQTSPSIVTISFDLADTKNGELEDWRAIMEVCGAAPHSDNEFQQLGNGRRNFYFSPSEHVLCQYSEDDAVNAFIDSSDLPRTHRLVVATRNGATQWTFGPIPTRERN